MRSARDGQAQVTYTNAGISRFYFHGLIGAVTTIIVGRFPSSSVEFYVGGGGNVYHYVRTRTRFSVVIRYVTQYTYGTIRLVVAGVGDVFRRLSVVGLAVGGCVRVMRR